MHKSWLASVACDESERPLPPSTSQVYRSNVNGVSLAYSMNPAPSGAPILVYLHGGPGGACIPLTQRYNAALEQHFRFINIDQRGCGLSYYPFPPQESITIELMLADMVAFVRRLRRAYPQAPITLLGHSWGSVLGLEFAKRYPELIKRFIGVGQVVDMSASHQARLHPVLEVFPSWLRQSFGSESALADGLLRVEELKALGLVRSLMQEINRSVTYLSSPYYRWRGIKGLLIGANQSHARLDKELDQVDFSNIHSFEVPVAFLEGRYDRHLPPELVEHYASQLKSEHKFVWFEHSAHCPQWEEPTRFVAVVEELCHEDFN